MEEKTPRPRQQRRSILLDSSSTLAHVSPNIVAYRGRGSWSRLPWLNCPRILRYVIPESGIRNTGRVGINFVMMREERSYEVLEVLRSTALAASCNAGIRYLLEAGSDFLYRRRLIITGYAAIIGSTLLD